MDELPLGYPRVTFGMIVLNGEPFLRYNLRALYPFAHQIIVVEGAAPAAVNIATPDGHSSDGTLGTLREFKAYDDPRWQPAYHHGRRRGVSRWVPG